MLPFFFLCWMLIVKSATTTITEVCLTAPVLRLIGFNETCPGAPGSPGDGDPSDDSNSTSKLLGSTVIVTVESSKTYISWLNEGEQVESVETGSFQTKRIFKIREKISDRFREALKSLSKTKSEPTESAGISGR
ncbi:hypothetical protein ROZALSC1DRAFT_25555, partial [Rozella allomycis CSF55]